MNKTLFIAFLLMLTSCSENNVVADQMTDIPDSKWNYFQIPGYPFQVDDAQIYYDFYLKLRIQKSYPYENLYLLSHIKGPDGKILTRRVNFTLTDETGKPLGRSSGNSVDYELPMFKDKKMPGIGQYTIAIEQNMRDSVVNGIESIGVKIKKGNPVF
jgi:gliding motility-associated lipoprotein GldH